MRRRGFIVGAAAAAGLAGASPVSGATGMYGLIGKMRTTPGDRDKVVAILLGSMGAMPGCRSYVVATDPSEADAIWITEVWADAASHQASLGLAEVRAAIKQARPMIAGFGERFETTPVGGFGLSA